MTSSAASNPSPLPRRRGIALVALALAVVVGGVLLLRPTDPPPPPGVNTDELDEPVKELIGSARQDVLDEPESAEAWGRLGGILLMNAGEMAAAECFRRAIELDRDEPRWHYLRAQAFMEERPQEALPDLRRAAALAGNDPAAPKLALAEYLFHRGGIDEASQLFSEVLRSDASNARALLGMGRVSQSRGELQKAVDFLERSLEQDPTRKPTQVLLAASLHQAGRVDRAAEISKHAAGLPERTLWPDPYRDELLKFHVGRQAKIAELTDLLERGAMQDLAAASEAVLEIYPDAPEAWRLLGIARAQRGDFSSAEEALTKAAELKPGSVRFQLDLALLMGIQQRFTEAANYSRAAIALSPRSAEARQSLGASLAALGDWDQAIPELQESVRLSLDNARYQVSLGEALLKAGKPEEAIAPLRSALALAPEQPLARRLLEQALELTP